MIASGTRYGILADVHGNLPALLAVVARLSAEGVERFLCAGDLVGYGPFPDECVEVIAGLDAVCVAGNHDLIALGRLSDGRCNALARDSLAWTRKRLAPASREYLEGLPVRVELDGVVLAHGSPDDPQRYVRDGTEAARQLATVAARWPAARVLVLGHTHIARAWAPGGRPLDTDTASVTPLARQGPVLLNPGAVGQSRERRVRARSLVLDLREQTVAFHADPYDVGACRRALRSAGLPRETVHLSPTLAGRAARRLRRAAAKGVRRRPRTRRDRGAPHGA
jgi:predicted phosphodiesterase